MIKTYQARIDAMDTSKGVSNQMIQTAMRAEIKELRKAVIAMANTKSAKELSYDAGFEAGKQAVAKQIKAAQTQLERERKAVKTRIEARLATSRNRALYWRNVAYATQRELDAIKKGRTR